MTLLTELNGLWWRCGGGVVSIRGGVSFRNVIGGVYFPTFAAVLTRI